MPCGKEEYIEIEKPNDPELIEKLFVFLQVDIHVLDNLKEKFSEFSSLFVVDSVPENMIPKHIKDNQTRTGRKMFQGYSFWMLQKQKISYYIRQC